jgi:hypothetical protein
MPNPTAVEFNVQDAGKGQEPTPTLYKDSDSISKFCSRTSTIGSKDCGTIVDSNSDDSQSNEQDTLQVQKTCEAMSITPTHQPLIWTGCLNAL